MTSQTNQWYLRRDGEQHGPLSNVELSRLVELGHARPSDLVWRQDFSEWRPLMSIFPERKLVPQPAAAKRPATLVLDREDYMGRQQLKRRGLSWTKVLIALICAALISAASGYAYEHYSDSTELTQRPGQR
jgi:GYF domain 2